MNKRKLFAVLLILAFIISACGAQPSAAPVTQATAAEKATEPPAAEKPTEPAKPAASAYSQSPTLDEQVKEELKIGEAHTTPLKEGWITGSATAVGAVIPVAPFLLFEGQIAIWTAFAIAMLSHFAVGAARSVFTGRSVIRSGIDMFVVGLGVAGVGYVVGDLVAKWLT